MIWLTWRQFRGQALVALAALAALTIYLVILGLRIRHSYDVNVNCGAACSISGAREALENAYFAQLLLSGFLVVAVPGLIGAFWGAPLIARELETGTHRLVWNQSVTRTRWLSVKLAFVTLAGVALTGAFSALLTWAASPYDKLFNGRFEPLVFPTRNIVPLGYAAFAIVAGIAIGLLTRRTVPAMALTLAVFAALQILLPTVIRPYLQPPITETVAFSADTKVDSFMAGADGVRIDGYGSAIPGAWSLSGNTPLLNANGDPVTQAQIDECFRGSAGGPGKALACIATKDLHFSMTYQPADRYWLFQWLEFAAYLVLAGLLAGFVFWRITRGLS